MTLAYVLAMMAASVFFWGFTAVLLFISWKAFRRWQKKRGLPRWKQLFILLPAGALVLALVAPSLWKFPAALPVPAAELHTVTAPVSLVKQLTTTKLEGRYGVRREDRYRIYLEDISGSLYVPANFSFDQDKFLAWAGTDPITVKYALTGGHTVPYIISNDNGSIFWDYKFTSDRLIRAASYDLVISISTLLLLGAGVFALPIYLYPMDGSRRGWIEPIFLVLLLVAVVVCVRQMGVPKVTKTPADTPPPPVVVEVREDIQITLPQGWSERGVNQEGTRWYKNRDNVSTAFRLTTWSNDLSEDLWNQWNETILAGFRENLLDTYIAAPNPNMGEFLQTLQSSAEKVPGTNFQVSEGYGAATSGTKNHFLVVLLNQNNAMLVIQSCSRTDKLTWSELGDYAEACIWPLLAQISITVNYESAYG